MLLHSAAYLPWFGFSSSSSSLSFSALSWLSFFRLFLLAPFFLWLVFLLPLKRSGRVIYLLLHFAALSFQALSFLSFPFPFRLSSFAFSFFFFFYSIFFYLSFWASFLKIRPSSPRSFVPLRSVAFVFFFTLLLSSFLSSHPPFFIFKKEGLMLQLVLFLSSRFTLPLSVITVLPPRLNSPLSGCSSFTFTSCCYNCFSFSPLTPFPFSSFSPFSKENTSSFFFTFLRSSSYLFLLLLFMHRFCFLLIQNTYALYTYFVLFLGSMCLFLHRNFAFEYIFFILFLFL